jgi:hypothetical protein
MLGMMMAIPVSSQSKKLDGRWALTLSIPEAPRSNTRQTLLLTLDASPRDNSLHGRVTITDPFNRVFGGVWRQVGKKVSITFEMPCGMDEPCASLVLLAKLKKKTLLKKGEVIMMWDTSNNNDPSLFDTSKGTFSGQRLE